MCWQARDYTETSASRNRRRSWPIKTHTGEGIQKGWATTVVAEDAGNARVGRGGHGWKALRSVGYGIPRQISISPINP